MIRPPGPPPGRGWRPGWARSRRRRRSSFPHPPEPLLPLPRSVAGGPTGWRRPPSSPASRRPSGSGWPARRRWSPSPSLPPRSSPRAALRTRPGASPRKPCTRASCAPSWGSRRSPCASRRPASRRPTPSPWPEPWPRPRSWPRASTAPAPSAASSCGASGGRTAACSGCSSSTSRPTICCARAIWWPSWRAPPGRIRRCGRGLPAWRWRRAISRVSWTSGAATGSASRGRRSAGCSPS